MARQPEQEPDPRLEDFISALAAALVAEFERAQAEKKTEKPEEPTRDHVVPLKRNVPR